LENGEPTLSEWDTIAWVYKGSGNRQKAINKEKILPNSSDEKWKKLFEDLQK